MMDKTCTYIYTRIYQQDGIDTALDGNNRAGRGQTASLCRPAIV
jgi:hypothetical protein